jgi:hypothetical protein
VTTRSQSWVDNVGALLVVAWVGVIVWGIWNWTWVALIPLVVVTAVIAVVSRHLVPTLDSVVKDAAAAQQERLVFRSGAPVIVRLYLGQTESQASERMQAEARRAAAAGYSPVSLSWSEGAGEPDVVRPVGALTVTYRLRS